MKKIRFDLKFRDKYVSSFEELDNIDIELFIYYFDNGILSKWLKLHDYFEKVEFLENLKNKLDNINDKVERENFKIKELVNIFGLDPDQIQIYEKYKEEEKKLIEEKSDLLSNINEKSNSYLKVEYDNYEKNKNTFLAEFASKKRLSISGRGYYIESYKDLKSKKEELNSILENLNKSLEFWQGVKIIEKDLENSIKMKDQDGLQPIVYYLMLLDEFKFLKDFVISIFHQKVRSSVSECDYNTKKFLDFYSQYFIEYKEQKNIDIPKDSIIIEIKGFEDKNNNFKFEEFKKLDKGVEFIINKNEKTPKLIYLKSNKLSKVL